MENRNRELIAKISLAVFGMAVALVLAEIVARIVLPAPRNVRYTPDPIVGYRHVPNQTTFVRDEHGEYAAWFKTNANGDPDVDRSIDKPDGAFRIAVVGDSMVEAAQVQRKQRFTHLLEEQLTTFVQEQPVAIGKVEVMNFGTAGYSTAQEWLYYREHVRQFTPDVVLLVFLPGNDIKNNSYELEVVQSCRPEVAPFFRLTDDRQLVLQNEQFYASVVERFREPDRAPLETLAHVVRNEIRLAGLASQAFSAARAAAGSTGTKAPILNQDLCQTQTTLQLYDPAVQQASRDWQDAWRVTEAILWEFSRDAAADGSVFHLVTVTGPWEVQAETRGLVLSEAEQAGYDWDLPQQMAVDMVARLGIPHLSVYQAMQQAAQAEATPAIHYLYNGHYTPDGHQILAREIYPMLEQYLLEKATQ